MESGKKQKRISLEEKRRKNENKESQEEVGTQSKKKTQEKPSEIPQIQANDIAGAQEEELAPDIQVNNPNQLT